MPPPTNKVGAKGAVEILYGHGHNNNGHNKKDKSDDGKHVDNTNSNNIEHATAEYSARFANPLLVAQRGFIDDILDPPETRRRLCRDLNVLQSKQLDYVVPRKKHTNMPL